MSFFSDLREGLGDIAQGLRGLGGQDTGSLWDGVYNLWHTPVTRAAIVFAAGDYASGLAAASEGVAAGEGVGSELVSEPAGSLAAESTGADAGLVAEPPAEIATEITSGNPAAQDIIADEPWGVNPQGEPGMPDAGADVGSPGGELGDMGPNSGPQQQEQGIIGRAMDWVNKTPQNTTIAAKTIGGVAQGAMQNRAAERKSKADREAREYNATIQQRLKQGNPSVGGGGVNLNMRRGADGVLRRPDGSPVYRQGSGIIQGQMNGVRG